MTRSSIFRLSASVLLLGSWAAAFWGAEAGALRVGAARVDITPAADAGLPMSGYASRTQGFKGIHDNIYVRAIILDDGTTQAVLVAWELLCVPNQVWAETSQRSCLTPSRRPGNRMRIRREPAETTAPAMGISFRELRAKLWLLAGARSYR